MKNLYFTNYAVLEIVETKFTRGEESKNLWTFRIALRDSFKTEAFMVDLKEHKKIVKEGIRDLPASERKKVKGYQIESAKGYFMDFSEFDRTLEANCLNDDDILPIDSGAIALLCEKTSNREEATLLIGHFTQLYDLMNTLPEGVDFNCTFIDESYLGGDHSE